jgi:hypothetical protein
MVTDASLGTSIVNMYYIISSDEGMSPSEHVLHHVLEYIYISPMRVWVQAL